MSSKLIAKVAWWDISMEIKKKIKQKWRLHNARPQLLAGKKHLELVINAPNKAWHLFKACSYMFKINNKIKTAAVNFSSFFRSSRLEVYIKDILKNFEKEVVSVGVSLLILHDFSLWLYWKRDFNTPVFL